MYGQEFREFCVINQIDSFHDHNGKLYLTSLGFETICKIVKTFDGSKGGLIFGKSHSEGGIHLLQKNADGSFKYVGEMEGNEYLSPPKLKTSIFKELEEINIRRIGIIETIPQNINIIDLRAEKIQILILAETTQFIINKDATMSNLNRITEIVNNYC
ncbi:MAG: hypothetical protein HYZ14_17530 [Bacteroidetes bacterium]|nr:hypothetical protein [Bacteroidota bacterium]